MFSSIFTCASVFLVVFVPSPNCPTLFFPVLQTVPSSFSTIVNPSPTPTCGIVMAPSTFLYTFTIAFAFNPFVLYAVIVAVPIPIPVTTPFSSTFATSSFDDVHVFKLS